MALKAAKILRSSLTREEFTKRAFNKSKSVGSKAVVESALINFDDFCLEVYQKISDQIIDELKQKHEDELYHFLQDFIDFMDEKKLKPGTIRAYFSYIRSFLRNKGIKIYSEDIRDLIRFPVQLKEMLEPLTKNQIKILLDNSKADRKALYLTLLSSGMRVSEALSLRKKNFNLSKDPVTIKIQAKHTKTKQARETFISLEAKEMVLRLLKNKTDDDLVFGKSEDYKKALVAEERVFSNLRIRCQLAERYEESIRHKITIHSMRSFFHTQASLIHDEQYANAMDGHSGYLMQYYRLSFEKRVEMYRNLEPSLLIYTDERIAQNHEDLRGKVQDQARDIEKLKKMIEIMQNTKPSNNC